MAVHYGYGIKVYLYDLDPPEDIKKLRTIGLGQFKYLTFWDMLLQFSYFTLAFVNDIVGSNTLMIKKQSTVQKIRDFFFSTVALAIGTFVTISFWGLYNVDRRLIFPETFDSWFPLWLNHNIHTTPGLGVLAELYLVPHSFPRRKTGLSVVAIFCLLYLSWVCLIAYQSGHWVYPVLAHLSVPGRVLFISSMSTLISLMYLVGEALNSRMWGGRRQKTQ
ncbi:hypothetical protein Pmani_017740 [Petrolisthes manimaculis]|uniref:Uncharacterized protein n=1 Tax=Petrolisthes manimaculis TaxID=1843537 RepID=A0AAE1PLQ8_9EUCA|nr:hypothetical protein Pmani_017740 [Petrolisthes manimaculis]